MTRERARIERVVQPFTKDAQFFVADEPCITAAKAVTLIRRELAKERGRVRRIVNATQLSDFAKNIVLAALRKGTR